MDEMNLRHMFNLHLGLTFPQSQNHQDLVHNKYTKAESFIHKAQFIKLLKDNT